MSSSIALNYVLPKTPVTPLVKQIDNYEATDRKIYYLVALGYFLRGVAIVAATALIAYSITATPLFLLGLIPSLALERLGHRIANARAVADGSICIPGITPSVFIDNQPLGIKNIDSNCWVNSLLQMIIHVPSLQAVVNALPSEFQPLRTFIQNYHLARQSRQGVSENIDSQKVRECLHRVSRGARGGVFISTDAGHQEDVDEALGILLNRAQSDSCSLFQRVQTFANGALITDVSECHLPIDLYHHNKRPFNELVREYFQSIDPRGRSQRRIYFEPPQELLIKMNRFTHDRAGESIKINDSIAIPALYSLPGEYVRSGRAIDMECDCFIEHIGDSPHSGHYIVFVKNSRGGWWRCNDLGIMPVTDDAAQKAMRLSYILHYRRCVPTTS